MRQDGARPTAARLGDRVLASLWDYLVVLAILAVGGLVALTFHGPAALSVGQTDAVVLAVSVAPTWAYLTVSESAVQATWGKRCRRLQVITVTGRRPGVARCAVRNAVKLLPWQLAHVAVVRMVLEVDDVALTAVAYVAGVALAVTTVLTAWRTIDHRALHDLVAGTMVVPTPTNRVMLRR